MKPSCIVLFALALSCQINGSFENFQVQLEPMWQDLQHNSKLAKEFGGKWILLGSITFKKKLKEDIKLDKMYLKWNGSFIKNLNASLYKKNPEKKFLAIEENLVCDSNWNNKDQTLVLNFNKKHRLGAVDVFYLVLTVPYHIEKKLKNGTFVIEEQCLPGPFKLCAKDDLTLAVHIPEPSLLPESESLLYSTVH